DTVAVVGRTVPSTSTRSSCTTSRSCGAVIARRTGGGGGPPSPPHAVMTAALSVAVQSGTRRIGGPHPGWHGTGRSRAPSRRAAPDGGRRYAARAQGERDPLPLLIAAAQASSAVRASVASRSDTTACAVSLLRSWPVTAARNTVEREQGTVPGGGN